MALLEKLKSDWNQTWFIGIIWEPSYVRAVKGHIPRSKVIWGQVVWYGKNVKMALFEKLKSDWSQTWFIDMIWEPSYVRVAKDHTKIEGHIRSGCKIGWKCENGLIWKVEVRFEPNCGDLDQMLTCIIHKPRWQVTLVVRGPQSIFLNLVCASLPMYRLINIT